VFGPDRTTAVQRADQQRIQERSGGTEFTITFRYPHPPRSSASPCNPAEFRIRLCAALTAKSARDTGKEGTRLTAPDSRFGGPVHGGGMSDPGSPAFG
jgi:hypothetical protein